ncbi:MAG: hypothetical protein WCJ81_07645 [bacterium]
MYEPFQQNKHDLIVDIKKVLSIKDTPVIEAILDSKTKKQFSEQV